MKLLIDAGNSCIKWATSTKNEFRFGDTIRHTQISIIEKVAVLFSQINKPEAIWVANVTGQSFVNAISEWVDKHWQVPITFVSTEKQAYGVTNAYPDYEKLGVDRWINLIAVRQMTQSYACIIDLGTATKVDVLAPDGKHLGGLIIPGLSTMRDSLIQSTEGINNNAFSQIMEDAPSLLAQDTGSAINGGIIYATVAFLDRIIEEVASELNQTPKYFLAGGSIRKIAPLLNKSDINMTFEANLVLKGLAVIANH